MGDCRMKIFVLLFLFFIIGCSKEKPQKYPLNTLNGDSFIEVEENIIIENNNIQLSENVYVYESDIFKNDLFIDISKDPWVYENDTSFTFNEYFPDFIHKGTPQKYIEVENDEIKIVYYPHDFSITGEYIIQFVTIKKYTDKYCFGDLFGKTSEKIMEIFITTPDYLSINQNGEGMISFASTEYINYVVFEFLNNIVSKINYGESI
jgi:hypothetical protein